MHLIVDVAGNGISLGGVTVRGRHRWEAAVLGQLLASCSGASTGLQRCEDMELALQALGQAQPLQRRQWARVIDGLRDCFQRLGAEALADFEHRFGHAPRQRTVGPWWWKPQPGDHWQLASAHAVAACPAAPERALPRLAETAAHADSVRLCRQMLVAQGLDRDGLRKEALAALLDDAAWDGASEELQAWRLLRGAEAATAVGAFDCALASMDAAETLTRQSLVANRLLAKGLRAARLQHQYSGSPGRSFDELLAQGPLWVKAEPMAHFGLSDADVWNLMSLAERRWHDRRAAVAPADERERHLRDAVTWSHAAIMLALARTDMARAQRYCASLGYLYQRVSALMGAHCLEHAMDWYAMAHALQQRFELPLSASWEFIFIGELWLGAPSLRAQFQEHVHRCVWNNERPDQLSFYTSGLSLAEGLGDPRQVARNALNLYAFAEAYGAGAEADRAVKALTAALKQQPALRALLVSEGCEFPAPLRRRRSREPGVA